MGSIAVPKVQFEDILAERRRSNDFRWASRPYHPSPYFVRGTARDPKELCKVVLSCERVQAAIREVALKEGKDEKELFKRAQDVLQEMAHDYHLYTVRWFGYVLSKISKSHYSSIFVNVQKIDQIRECFQRYPVILLPTHRSYVDFLLLSYVCFTYQLPLPIIAAGMDFMGMMGVAEMLRKAGAFFIRRRFGNDKLYWALISEYVKKAILHGSHPLEMFVEGTRSRSGKSLYPKIGLLTSIVELVRSREVPDVLILPISMSYDRTLEETLYAREMLGQPKPKESTNGLLKGLRWLGSQSYGSMYVNFGEFISVREFLGNSFPPSQDDAVFNEQVQQIALQTVLDHQKHLVLPLFSAVATVILANLSENENIISFPKLMSYIHGFRILITAKGSDFGQPLSGETLDWNLRFILSIHSSLVICPKDEEHIVRFQIGDDETVDAMKFQHYSNQFLPILIPFCIFSTLTKFTEEPDGTLTLEEDIMEEYVFLRQLLFEDFIYQQGTEKEEAAGNVTIFNSYLYKGRVNGHSKEWIAQTDDMKKVLRLALEPFLIAYWGVAKTLSQMFSREPEPVEMKQLGKMAQSFLRQLLGTNFPKQFGALSLDTLNNATMSFIKSGYAAKVKTNGGTSFGVILKDADNLSSLIGRLEKYLPHGTTSSSSGKDGASFSTSDPNSEVDFSQLLLLRSKL